MNKRNKSSGFTLAELLVVIAIIALLIGIALPSFRRARTQAKVAATKSTIAAIASGLEAFRTESALGNVYPPSSSDATAGQTGQIDSPYEGGGVYVPTTGANLVVYALAGPHKNGTAGFYNPNGPWSAITGGPGSGGLYDPAMNTPMYGPYAEGKLMEQTRPMRGLDFQGRPVGLVNIGVVRQTAFPERASIQPFFVDTFERPILYYRARSVARRTITREAAIGVYDQRDNAWLTGISDHGGPPDAAYNYAVQPTVFKRSHHPLGETYYEEDPQFGQKQGTFDNFILDSQSVVRGGGGQVLSARPVNASTYLLISAGPDGAYGTNDDVKNWGK